MVLNVVALIDVSSILIIFLVMGTVFGESSVVPPADMEMPRSSNKDSVTNAPQVTIMNDSVVTTLFGDKIPLAAFRGTIEESPVLQKLQDQIKKYIETMPVDLKRSGTLINVVADRRAPYKNIFDVIKFYRQAGFESILFVAQGD